MDHLTRWRMLLAGDRLANSSDPISVIALLLGYESESAFSTAFKSHGLFATGNIAVASIRLLLHIPRGEPPAPIGSNLSQVDMRGWRPASKHPFPLGQHRNPAPRERRLSGSCDQRACGRHGRRTDFAAATH
ncbi:MAG TPA: hypothetical protein VMI52_09275 [Acetobacteraceae bacterium]|nr:hypothetical protein [Acetobacteraceae bacterium]